LLVEGGGAVHECGAGGESLCFVHGEGVAVVEMCRGPRGWHGDGAAGFGREPDPVGVDVTNGPAGAVEQSASVVVADDDDEVADRVLLSPVLVGRDGDRSRAKQ